MDINELVTKSHNTAKEKGWWDILKSPLEVHALIHSEISEATEFARTENPYFFIDDKEKPQGEAIELVDAIIRIADWFGYNNWNLEELIKIKMNYNNNRSYRHGNKKY